MGKVAKLWMVTEANNNKYYFMFEQPDGTFNVEYGRVDATAQRASYSMYQWDKKYREKVAKGYIDRTELYTIEDDSDPKATVDETFISNNSFVKRLIEDLKRWATNTVSANYKVSSKNVTQKMIDEAQGIIDSIARVYSGSYKHTDINELLLKLFTVIPRKMGNVKDYLVHENDNNDRVSRIIDEEQSLLDTMAGQVSMQEAKKEVITEADAQETKGILDMMGVEVEHVTDANEIVMIKQKMGDSAHMFSQAFKVKNIKTEQRYNDYITKMTTKNEELFFHGSRNANWFSIGLQSGLLIRPAGAITTGGMFGSRGLYFADKCRKSIGYTSLSGSYWANGNDNKAYIGLFRVNLGNQKHIYKHDSSCYNLDKNNIKPYDSVYAHGGVDLINSEYIIYDIAQADIRYLIEIKK